MKKTLAVFVAALTLAALLCLPLSACAHKQPNPLATPDAGSTTYAGAASDNVDLSDSHPSSSDGMIFEGEVIQPGENTSAEQTAPHEQSYSFALGAWISSIENLDRTMYFFSDERSGSTSDLVDGFGVPFNYETTDGGRMIIRFGGVDVNEECGYQLINSETVLLEFSDHIEILRHVSEKSRDALEWYTNTELEQLAVRYYAAHHDNYQPNNVGSITNGDGSVSIQLYDSLEDHLSTCAWYTVDRFSASGSDDLFGEAVDLRK